MNNNTIAFIGAGHMGASLIGGLLANGYAAHRIWISEPRQEIAQALQDQFAIKIAEDNIQAATVADVIVFAVKPQVIFEVATALSAIVQELKPLVISIAAGVRVQSLNRWLGDATAIVRCMPNTPALVGAGASTLYANKHVSEQQKSIAETLMRAVGIVEWISDEAMLDVVTALSGSGPAYFFLIMEILQQTAITLGLPENTARALTLQTALGAAKMALASNVDVTELRNQVTSKGGTTEQAINVLETKQVRALFAEALQAAALRARELAATFDKHS